jgi:flavodoxin
MKQVTHVHLAQEHIHTTDFPDSIDIGTPGKKGNLKVYFNASRFEEARERIRNAKKLLEYAREMDDLPDKPAEIKSSKTDPALKKIADKAKEELGAVDVEIEIVPDLEDDIDMTALEELEELEDADKKES